METDDYSPLYLTNFSTSPGEEMYDSTYLLCRAINVTIYSITFLLGTVGNGLVIWIIGFKMEKTTTLILFLNLGIADFSFCLFLPLSITQWALMNYWPFGWIMCKTWAFFFFYNLFLFETWAFNLYLTLCASVLFLMIISVDRCICVLYPMLAKIHRTSRSASIISVIIWVLSVALSFPYIVFYDQIYHNQVPFCTSMFAVWANATSVDMEIWEERYKAMTVTRFVSMFLVPFSISLVCYGLIAFQVKKSTRIPWSGRTLKIIFTIVTCFFLCWFLFHTLPMTLVVDIYIKPSYLMLLDNLGQCLAFFNSFRNKFNVFWKAGS
ncbi:hypothetical protein XELAEV_18036281mg [Xenopus laevis]|uniref:G-protein coupled receptors family 1 profile domain-containing protein n=1 Tax=Xenopus laevis TaxID=8355 RepID=A0A974CH79_XENLA|nr:hypothetical protein XELAEV_18036281mg [Xenopus laevis]